jgi:ubiquinone/menaquinone biosynthesis C-methylase UbiE
MSAATSDADSADPLDSEFDTVAGWTEEAVGELGPDYAVIAACRGSAHPAALGWLAEQLGLRSQTRLLDSGGGIGGPAAWWAQNFGAHAVVTDPMPSAMGAAHRLFGLPTAIATSQQLPCRDASFDAAALLGVLSVTDDKAGVIREKRRILRPGGRLGLLVYARQQDRLDEQPVDTSFASWDEVQAMLNDNGFTINDSAFVDELPESPSMWREREAAVEQLLAQRHGGDERWRQAQRQSELIGQLIARGLVRATLAIATAAL